MNIRMRHNVLRRLQSRGTPAGRVTHRRSKLRSRLCLAQMAGSGASSLSRVQRTLLHRSCKQAAAQQRYLIRSQGTSWHPCLHACSRSSQMRPPMRPGKSFMLLPKSAPSSIACVAAALRVHAALRGMLVPTLGWHMLAKFAWRVPYVQICMWYTTPCCIPE